MVQIPNILRQLRNGFITGIAIVLPIVVTFFVVKFLVDRIGVPATELFFWYVEPEIRNQRFVNPVLNLVSLLFVLVFITGLGFLSRYVIGRAVLGLLERAVNQIPFVNNVYRTVKQIVDTFSTQEKAIFQTAVLVEYPRKGVYVLGFLTSDSKGETQEKTSSELKNIFVPTTPNPTSGFLLMVPIEEIIFLEMSIGEAMKLIISGGAVTPPWQPDAGTAQGASSVQPPASQPPSVASLDHP
ncbi:MAG: DUF502 domain-containing protein [Puniceicoccaceae bacterium]